MFNPVLKCTNLIILEYNENNNILWYLCLVYGEPVFANRKSSWDTIGVHLKNLTEPFVLLGDVNQVEMCTDKHGGDSTFIQGVVWFNNWKLAMNLVDIPFKGPRFTWCNKRKGEDRLYERLDKAYASHDWFTMYSDVGVFHHPIQISDHAPIEIDFTLNRLQGKRPYRIEAWNLDCTDYMEAIKENWKVKFEGSMAYRCTRKPAHIRNTMMNWSINKRKEWASEWISLTNNSRKG
ncbi:hypothetical protein RND81_04G135100 [Saponaria officinalis]|uniref:Uncharacterized protein n=1 Tax=Saponaria officinalis TaxID=3572 RepID=A0AAW1LLD2_SAPOF